MKHYLLCNADASGQSEILKVIRSGYPDLLLIHHSDQIDANSKDQTFGLLVFANLDWLGQDSFIASQLSLVFERYKNRVIKGGFIVYSSQYRFTKRYAQQMTFILNQRGFYFPGHSLFEVLPGFENLKTWQYHLGLPMEEVWQLRLNSFIEDWMFAEALSFKEKPRILAIHASHHPTSNTLTLWHKVVQYLEEDFLIREVGLQNGTIADCKGCEFTTCTHYAENRSCYYGGPATSEILPAIEGADIIVWVSPNYNDAVSAMHAALINRLTVLYRRISFKNKAMYGVVVSGNSGCDTVACQLIGALNINKGFYLPPNAMLTAIANLPGAIESIDGLQGLTETFANRIHALIK